MPASDNLATSMCDDTVIQTLLQDAGFSKISIEKVAQLSVSATASEAAYGLVKGGPYYKEIKNRNPALIDEINMKLATALAEKFGAAPWWPHKCINQSGMEIILSAFADIIGCQVIDLVQYLEKLGHQAIKIKNQG